MFYSTLEGVCREGGEGVDLLKYEVINVGKVMRGFLSLRSGGGGIGGGSGGGRIRMDS